MTRCTPEPVSESLPPSSDFPPRADHLADVTAAVIGHLLPAVNDAITPHPADDCPWCTPDDRRTCPLLGLTAAALDLVIRCWRIAKEMRYQPFGRAPRDLHAAVRSGWLSATESAALVEILGVLDLASTQADAAGINLPMLSGMGVAIVDSYRAITAVAPAR